jgi:hypothetical protein
MSEAAIFGLSVIMSFAAFGIVTKLYVLPRIGNMERNEALLAMVVPHTFRFVGLSLLVPGVVSGTLESAFAAPAAYGDLVAALLAMVATLALATRSAVAIPIVWIFNLWGTGDLLHAMYEGRIGVGVSPGSLGADFFIPTGIVPPLLIIHGLIFWLLLRPIVASQSNRAHSAPIDPPHSAAKV